MYYLFLTPGFYHCGLVVESKHWLGQKKRHVNIGRILLAKNVQIEQKTARERDLNYIKESETSNIWRKLEWQDPITWMKRKGSATKLLGKPASETEAHVTTGFATGQAALSSFDTFVCTEPKPSTQTNWNNFIPQIHITKQIPNWNNFIFDQFTRTKPKFSTSYSIIPNTTQVIII